MSDEYGGQTGKGLVLGGSDGGGGGFRFVGDEAVS